MSGEEGEELSFEDDAGASRPTWIAGAILLAIVLWMGSGALLPGNDANDSPPREEAGRQPVAVGTETSTASSVTLFFQAEGQALPDRETAIRAESSGSVAEVLIRRGRDVEENAVIARLSTTRAEADLARAREERARAQREFDNASELLDRGVATGDRLSQARATLASAEAAVAAAEQAVEALDIIAPFAGRLETLTLDAGEFVQAGAEVGRIVDNRPLTVAIQVPQQQLGRIADGQTARVTFITGEERDGVVTFVGTSANRETRTFLAEIEVDNADGAIPAGISARVVIPTGQTQAHFVQASTVSLSPEGVLGVKTVDAEDHVTFHPIEIARAEIDGMWVTGLPETARIITVGQGFVRAGETVRPSTIEGTASDPADGN
jgi:multidrug efflux system membrane fusion protein